MNTGYVAALRQSRTTEDSVSLATQLAHIRNYAALHNLTEVTYTEDKSTSGAVSPFARAGLGPWLNDPDKVTQWRTLLAYKVDRVSRSLLDFVELLAWCDRNGKRLVCVSEGIDTETEVGKMVAQILAVFAEFQRGQIRARIADAKQQLRGTGRYIGGAPPYGYRRTKATVSGLEVDPIAGPLVRDVLQRVIGGASYAEAAEWLSQHSRTPRGNEWRPGVVARLLHRVVYRGIVPDPSDRNRATPERDSTGAIKYHDGGVLIAEDEFNEMQAAVATRSRPQTAKSPATVGLLSGVGLCGECGRRLYKYVGGKNNKKGYYRCQGRAYRLCTAKLVGRTDADTVVESMILNFYGHRKARLRKWDPGNDTSAEISTLKDRVESLLANFGDDPTILDQVTRQVGAYSKRIQELESEPQREAGWVYEDSSLYFSDMWIQLPDDVERNRLLKDLGATVKLTSSGLDPSGLASLDIPGWPEVTSPDRKDQNERARKARLRTWMADNR